MRKNSVRMDVLGLADLEKSLSNLSKSVARGVLRKSMREAAKPMLETAKRLAPVDDGELRDSIIIGTMLNGSQKKKRRKLTKEERASVELFVGPSYTEGAGGRHGHLVEFGTAPHQNKGAFAGTKHPGTKPQPFMRPAFDTQAQPTIERLKPILMREIDRAAARQAKSLAKGKG